MTIDMDYYRKINGLFGTTGKRDYLQKQATKSVNNAHSHVLSTFEILVDSDIAEDIIVDGITSMKCIFDYGSTIQATKNEVSSYTKEMWIEIGKVHVGSIITHTDKVSLVENTYIVTIKEEDTRGYDLCYIQKTNNTLLYYSKTPPTSPDPITNDPYSIHCIIGKGNLGLETNKFISLASDEYLIICPNSADSLKIDLNTRFLLSKSAYKVIGVDNISVNGLLNIRVKEDTTNSDDNLELGIANYYSNQHIYTILISNDNITRNINDTLQLNTICSDNNVQVESPILLYNSSNPLIVSVNELGLMQCLLEGESIITVNYNNVSASINIVVKNEAIIDSYSVSITPSDSTLKVSRSLVLTASAMNNGVEDLSKEFIWSIINEDGSSAVKYANISSVNGNVCTITASSLSSVANKYVVVRCELVGIVDVFGNAVVGTKRIKIIGLY